MSETRAGSENGNFVVTRRVSLANPIAGETMQPFGKALESVDGVSSCRIDARRGRMQVTYDASRIGFAVIEQAVEGAGGVLARGGWARLKSAWFRYLDANAKANASGGAGACCSNPGDVYASRRHKS
jgi:hypothetical protein